ncbi:MAG: two-component regulator propeller domain-containing protein [Candidatus Marinimicrobia bacterium]|nr:two-component regulator propeller domain-containing protein [Candidatus Neomarinimicrobiota bacterium]
MITKNFSALFIILLVMQIPGFAQDESDFPVRVYQLDDWISLKNCNYVTSFTESNEYIYFGTSGGIVPYHKYHHYWGDPYTVSNGMADDYILTVLYDYSTGYLWASHRAGVSYLNPTADAWENTSNESFDISRSDKIIRLGANNASICALSSIGQIKTIDKQLGYYQGSYSDESNSINWSPSRLDPIPSVENYTINQPYRIDGRGVVWDDNFQEYSINLFYSDKRLDIYGGIWGLGILTGDFNVKMLEVHSFGPMQNSISSLSLANNRIVTGSLGSTSSERTGISILDFDSGQWVYHKNKFIPELASANIFDIVEDKSGNIWIGTDLGLSIYNDSKNRWKRLSMAQGLRDENIWTIFVDDTLAWIGTPLGLNKIYTPTMKIKRLFLTRDKRHMKIYKISCDNDFIWIGTDNGLYNVDKLTHNVEHYDMNGNRIDINTTIASDIQAITSNDSITIVSQYDGLLSYNHITKGFYKYPQFIDAQVLDMDMTENYLWLATDNGAYLIRLNDFYIEHYLPRDGLAGRLVNKVRIDGEYVWFGTDQGLSRYNWRRYAN